MVHGRWVDNSHPFPPDRGRCVPATELEFGPADYRSHKWSGGKTSEEEPVLGVHVFVLHNPPPPDSTLLLTDCSVYYHCNTTVIGYALPASIGYE